MVLTVAGWIARRRQLVVNYLVTLSEQLGNRRLRFKDSQRTAAWGERRCVGTPVSRRRIRSCVGTDITLHASVSAARGTEVAPAFEGYSASPLRSGWATTASRAAGAEREVATRGRWSSCSFGPYVSSRKLGFL